MKIKNFSNLGLAVNDVVVEVLSQRSEIVNLIWTQYDHDIEDMRQEVLLKSLKTSKVTFRAESLSSVKAVPNRRKRNLVIFVKNFGNFEEIIKKLTPDVFRYSGLLLVVLVERIREVDEIFRIAWSKQIVNVNVMYEVSNGSIFVESFLPFRSESCNSTSSVVINEFKGGKFTQDMETFFPDKLRNLHLCPVGIALANTSRPYIFVNLYADGRYDYKGGEIELLRTLASALNFRLNFSYIGLEGFLFENGSSEGIWRALHDGVADLSVNGWYMKNHRSGYFDPTISYISESIIFVVPPGSNFSPAEKLIYPFSMSFWMCIVAVLLVAVFVITVARKQNENIRSFIFGRGVKTPIMNLVAGLLGGSQRVLPCNNFARFILMVFLLFALIIRTLYQASYFNLVQSNKHHKELEKIDEIIDRGYEILYKKGSEEFFEVHSNMRKR